LVRCEGVSLSYDGVRRAVDELTFTVEAGSIFALVGPNGAGKTSTLRMLATLTEPSAGAISVDGIDPARDREGVRKKVGYLPDHFSLYDHMTPEGYLEFFARCHGVDEATRLRRAGELLAEFDLVEKKGHAIRTLSRGMRQRLGLAKTLMHDPKVLLLDEPASALDPIATAKIEELLKELQRDYSIAIVTHNMQQAARVSDFTAFMYLGRMLEYSKTDDLFTNPRVKETEDYITGRFG
jgi:ABC-2 type transport system ATP-binding protein